MHTPHPKTIRRKLLLFLYERYLQNPLEMFSPTDFLEHGEFQRTELMVNMHYLGDRQLAEVMVGYNPPMFDAARITANGIDLVENRFELDRLFPPRPDELESQTASLPLLLEKLVAEVDFAPLDGEARHSLLRDVQFLREELMRPVDRWRIHVIEQVSTWMAANFETPQEVLPSLEAIRAILREI